MQHSLPSGRYPLLGPVFHRLNRTKLAWRAHSITSKASCLVLVRLAHDRRFVGAVLSVLFFFVLVAFIRISGRHPVVHDREGATVDPGGKFLGDVWGHVIAPQVWSLGDFTRSAPVSALAAAVSLAYVRSG